MMNRKLSAEQIEQLVDAWRKNENGSLEQKLIEDLFLITETCLPQVLDTVQDTHDGSNTMEYLGVA